ncbi:hypothetical protein ACET3Z_030161 [Daucus carota]
MYPISFNVTIFYNNLGINQTTQNNSKHQLIILTQLSAAIKSWPISYHFLELHKIPCLILCEGLKCRKMMNI